LITTTAEEALVVIYYASDYVTASTTVMAGFCPTLATARFVYNGPITQPTFTTAGAWGTTVGTGSATLYGNEL
jgi:hypothetical protein